MHRRALMAGGGGCMLSTMLPRSSRSQPQGGSVLRIIPSVGLSVLDPIFSGAYVSVCHGYAVFDTLFGVDTAQTVQPQMADGYQVSDDGRTWTIRLRDGLRFHDGAPVRAADCVASLVRWAGRSAGQVVRPYVTNWAASDDRTLTVTLRQPMPTLALMLGTAIYPPFIMPERIAQTDPARPITEMVGSGPFRFKADEYVSNSLVAYERFEAYVPRQEPADWTAGGKRAQVDRIEWHVVPDPATAAAALQRSEVDWVERPIADLLPALKAQPNITLASIDPTGWTGFLRFNQLQPPFNNLAVRQAVMAALKQQDFLDVATGGDPSASTVCKSVFPCGTEYGSQAGAAAMPGDIGRAKAMLQTSGYAGEKVVLLSANDLPPLGDFATIAADAMQKMGMNVDLVSTDWGTVTQRRAKKEPVSQGGWSAFISLVNGPAIMNPAVNFLIRGQGQAGYFGWYEDAGIETLARSWLEATTAQERASLAGRIQAIAFQTVPEVPLGQFIQRTAYLSNVSGVLHGPAMLPWNVRKT